MFVLVSSNLVNWFGNWLLIEGHWHFPALGVVGSALSTCVARFYMAAALAAFIWWFERRTKPGLRSLLRKPDGARLKLLLRIGFPAATQIMLEIGAFGAAAMLAGRLSPAALAARSDCDQLRRGWYMVPLGIASAAAVAVGQSIGRRHFPLARREGFIAITLGSAFMICSAAISCPCLSAAARVYR